MAGPAWRVRLGAAAELDVANILRWTTGTFGVRQAHLYRDTLLLAVHALGDGPHPPGSRMREEIGPGIHTLHVARGGRRGRHFLLYRVADERTIEIVRVLHDSMDLGRHLPPA